MFLGSKNHSKTGIAVDSTPHIFYSQTVPRSMDLFLSSRNIIDYRFPLQNQIFGPPFAYSPVGETNHEDF